MYADIELVAMRQTSAQPLHGIHGRPQIDIGQDQRMAEAGVAPPTLCRAYDLASSDRQVVVAVAKLPSTGSALDDTLSAAKASTSGSQIAA